MDCWRVKGKDLSVHWTVSFAQCAKWQNTQQKTTPSKTVRGLVTMDQWVSVWASMWKINTLRSIDGLTA